MLHATPRRTARAPLPAALFVLLAACGEGPVGERAPLAAGEPAEGVLAEERAEAPAPAAEAEASRDVAARDPRLDALIDAIDRSRADRVQALLPRVASLRGAAAEIARARADLVLGRGVEALSKLEALRRSAPERLDVLAALVEAYALLGEEGSAEETLGEAVAAGEDDPSVQRARGLFWLLQPGGASRALQHLELAVLADPGLPYAGRPLAEARRLVARQAMGEGDPERAEMHVLAALDHDPTDVGTRLLLADARAALLDFEGAIELHEELLAEGAGREQELAQLHKRAAMALLLEDDRAAAIEHFLRARELGLAEDLLGWGATALRDEAEASLGRGLERYAEDDLEGALAAFERGLVLDPDSLELAHKLGVVLFRLGRYGEAAERWAHVLERSLEEGRGLPVPVHLDLARAHRMAGDVEEAREVLERYLESGGEWREETEEMLERL